MFTTYPTYPRYRTLALVSPMQQGEDVFALQIALQELGFSPGEADGIFGPQTNKAVRLAQKSFIITVDGLAGGNTQKHLALEIATNVARSTGVPYSAFTGQLELESGYRLGNYSEQRSDRTYDAGVTQRNSKYTPPADGFDPKKSIEALGVLVRKHYDLFEGVPGLRRWSLAQGAWNAPAYACYIAREEGARNVTSGMTAQPTSAARAVFEAYVASASAYLHL